MTRYIKTPQLLIIINKHLQKKKIGNKYYMYNHLIGFNDQFYDITVYSVVPPHNTLKSTNLKHVLILRKKKLWKKDTDKQYMH